MHVAKLAGSPFNGVDNVPFVNASRDVLYERTYGVYVVLGLTCNVEFLSRVHFTLRVGYESVTLLYAFFIDVKVTQVTDNVL